MNIFVLSTGRAGSYTFYKACQYIDNYSAGHETRVKFLGSERLKYPDNHIEIDNRLTWLLGRLDQQYGNNAIYIHLTRDKEATAKSFSKRFHNRKSIIKAYKDAILMSPYSNANYKRIDYSRDYIATVNSNITFFLKDKKFQMNFHVENAKQDFRRFWSLIQAEGDLSAAEGIWHKKYNRSG